MTSRPPLEAKAQGVRRAQAAQTEAALKQAALRVFARSGYLNTKIVDITQEAGRSAGSFYTYFPSKEALLESLYTDLLAEADAQVQQGGPNAHSHDFSDRAAIRWHVATYWANAKQHRIMMTALRQAATVDESFARRMQELARTDLAHIGDHLRLAQQQGVRLPGDPDVVASAVTALMGQFAEHWLGPGSKDRELGDDEAIETLTSFIAGGIGL